jgi:hypothetical protein
MKKFGSKGSGWIRCAAKQMAPSPLEIAHLMAETGAVIFWLKVSFMLGALIAINLLGFNTAVLAQQHCRVPEGTQRVAEE